MQITFAVPAETTSCFVVAADRAPTELSSVIPWRMPRPHRHRAATALGTPRLTVTRHGPTHVIISSTASPSCQTGSAPVARAAARAVREEYGGVIDDPLTGNLIAADTEGAAEPSAFHLSDDWLGWQVEINKDVACPHQGKRSSACTPLSVGTRGLSRFGMPEIMLDGAACGHAHRPIEFLRAVAQRLLTEHLSWLAANPSAGVRTMCDHLRINAEEFAAPDTKPWPLPNTGPWSNAETGPTAALDIEPATISEHDRVKAVDDGPVVAPGIASSAQPGNAPERPVAGDGRPTSAMDRQSRTGESWPSGGATLGQTLPDTRRGVETRGGEAADGEAGCEEAGSRVPARGESGSRGAGADGSAGGGSGGRGLAVVGAARGESGSRGAGADGSAGGGSGGRGSAVVEAARDDFGAACRVSACGDRRHAYWDEGLGCRRRRFVVVRLSLESGESGAGRLRVGPPTDFDGDLDEWLRLALGQEMPGWYDPDRLAA